MCAQETVWFEVKQGNTYQTRFSLSPAAENTDRAALKTLLEQHLTLHDAMRNPRMNDGEWHRMVQKTPQEISDLLATQGYFKVRTTMHEQTAKSVTFHIDLPAQATIHSVNMDFTGEIASQPGKHSLSVEQCRQAWALQPKQAFTQEAWTSAKRALVGTLLRAEFPNARLTESRALIDPQSHLVTISIKVDSGPAVRFGKVSLHGLKHYDARMFEPLVGIRPGTPYQQSELLNLQNALMASGKFSQVDVVANTSQLNSDQTADIDVTVHEQDQKNVRIGVGASTNTGARMVFNYTDRNLFDRGLLWDSSVRLEQRLQAATSNITFLTDDKGYRDSIQNSVTRTALEGQVTTAVQNGVRRYWGQPAKFEQFVGANLLYEFLTIDGDSSQFNKAATVAYGINIRQLDFPLAPTKGWILNTQFQLAPFDRLSDGRFLQSQARVQAFYPLTSSTQWLGRFEAGMISGSTSVPATYLFRAGGDQSVRGYAFQSLGVKDGDAITGGRVLLTGSSEIVQWLTHAWGAAVFVDFGNAANRWQDYDPALGYGLGVRWRSPIGPVGVDIAYGEQTKDYRLHFNLGVNF